ncbi:hypothetical protein ACFQQB_39550 [Nonomuraea rubra]|uniref:hypothetical protein n=1 Tax=Nonomuraea rubra TaxID=46180 RepID=UPI0036108291
MASTPARDLPLLTGPLTGLLPTGWVGTGPENAPDDGAEGTAAGTGGGTAAWPQRSQ